MLVGFSLTSVTRHMSRSIQTIDDVHRFLALATDYEKQVGGRTRDTFDLERMHELLGRLVRPDMQYACAHVAGTKGKGSTSRFIEAALRSQGLKTGLYTSPHLERLTERIAIDGREIDEAGFVRAFREVVEALDAEGGAPDVTFFELLTLTAMVAFREAGVEVAVFEVGLGGRLDATNVISPQVCVITEIGLDHTQQLGSTIAEIAREKAGIIKPGVPVVCGAKLPEAVQVISLTARDEEAPIFFFGRDYRISRLARTGWSLSFQPEIRGLYPPVQLAHPGRFMADNAAHALLAFELLVSGSDLVEAPDRTAAARAMESVPLPGRLERFEGSPTVILDSAHNEVSLSAALETVRAVYPERLLVCVFGVAKDKDLESCLRVLAERADAAVFTSFRSPRATPPADLETLYRKFGGREPSVEVSPKAALERALRLAGGAGLVLITGSTYLAGELRGVARKDHGEKEG